MSKKSNGRKPAKSSTRSGGRARRPPPRKSGVSRALFRSEVFKIRRRLGQVKGQIRRILRMKDKILAGELLPEKKPVDAEKD